MKLPVMMLCLLMVQPGCGASLDGPERRPVSGRISYDDAPVAHGEIRFIPVESGPVAAALIQDGRYQFPNQNGVPVGQMRVEITATPDTSGMSEDQILEGKGSKVVEIPRKYNLESTLREEIPAGSDEFELNFELQK